MAGRTTIIFLVFFVTILSANNPGLQAQELHNDYRARQDQKGKDKIRWIDSTVNRIHLVRDANPDSSLKLLKQVYSTSAQIGYLQGIGAAAAEIGGTYVRKGRFDDAEKFILYSQLFPQLNEYVSTNAINNLYLVYESRGDYKTAIKYLKKAMASKDANVANTAYNNYIALLSDLGRFREALYYTGVLKTKAKALKQNIVLAALLCNEAAIYSSLKEYRISDSVSDECRKLCTGPAFELVATCNEINSGTSYSERGDTRGALRIFAGIEAKIPQLSIDYQAAYFSEYGKVLYKTGLYSAAINNFLKGKQLAKLSGIKNMIEPVYYLAKSYQALGDNANASRQFENYIQLNDSFRNVQVQKNISEYEIKFRTAEKDNELLHEKLIILSQADRIDRKNAVLLLFVLISVVLFVTIFIYRKYTRQNLLVLERDLAIAGQKSRISFLKAVMQGEEKERKRVGVELHNGIGSQLTAINLNLTAFQWKNKHLPEVDELKQIVDQVRDTAIEVRKTAHNLIPAGIMEGGLYHALVEFAYQFKNGPAEISISKQGAPELLDHSLAMLVYRMLQELISNAIKHAGATAIDVHLKLADNILFASVTDNGRGFDPSGTDSDGLGLRQIQVQVDQLNGKLGIHSEAHAGTTIYFEIDLKYSTDNR